MTSEASVFGLLMYCVRVGRTEGVLVDEIIQVRTKTKGKLSACELDDFNTPLVMSVKYYVSAEESTRKSFPFSRVDLANEPPADGGKVNLMHGLEVLLWPRLLVHAMRQFASDHIYPALRP